MSAERARERLLRDAGGSARGVPGHTRFTQQHGEVQSEIEVNDANGTIDIVRIASGGRTLQETKREYESRSGGIWVLKAERITRFDPKGGVAKTTVITYRNVRVLEEH